MDSISTFMPTIVDVIIAVVIGYLVGSIPVANAVAKRQASVDLRTVGDRNPGFWNARETLGKKAAIPVLVGDVAKGVVAAGVGVLIADDGVWGIAYVATAAAMIGHAYPVFANFKGGRSILTFVGGAAVFAPVSVAISVCVLIVVFACTRSLRLGFTRRDAGPALRAPRSRWPVPDRGDGGIDDHHRHPLRDRRARRPPSGVGAAAPSCGARGGRCRGQS